MTFIDSSICPHGLCVTHEFTVTKEPREQSCCELFPSTPLASNFKIEFTHLGSFCSYSIQVSLINDSEVQTKSLPEAAQNNLKCIFGFKEATFNVSLHFCDKTKRFFAKPDVAWV